LKTGVEIVLARYFKGGAEEHAGIMPVRRTGRKAHAIAVFLIAKTRALAIGASVTGANIFLAKPPRSPRGAETVPLRALRLGEKYSLLDGQMRRIQPEPGTSSQPPSEKQRKFSSDY